MKQAFVLIISVLYTCMGFSQQMELCEKLYDFGTIREADGSVSHDFDFMNTGEEPLVIKAVIASCGCTASEWPKTPVLPGEKARIRLAYHPENRHETEFLGVAEVYTNCGVIDLKIQGGVERKDRKWCADYLLEPEEVQETTKNGRPEDRFGVILERMREEMLKGLDVKQNDILVAEQVKALRRGGRWADLDYGCYFRTNWEQVRHLHRVYSLVVAYVGAGSRFYGNDSLFVAIRDALQYWAGCKPKSHNWWYNQIAVPQRLGDILVLLNSGKARLPEELQQQLYQLMAWPDPRKWTGANKQDIGLHHLQRGCLLKNDSIVRAAAEQIFYPLRFTTREGLQSDYSYQQHGNQLYIGGYGTVFVDCTIRAAGWLVGTPYALKNEPLELFSRFMRCTYLNVFRGPYIDYNVLGRGISREGAMYQGAMPVLLAKMQKLDPGHAGTYKKLTARFEESSDSCRDHFSQVFWRSDYALHNRKAFDFSVRTSSVRTVKIESGNGENLKGKLLSGGATCLRMTGDEYSAVFPLWNWNCIPGVTAYTYNENLFGAQWGEAGKNVFSGGVSDGEYSVMGYRMQDFGVDARKSWFMFDREVVCLGVGISGNRSGKVVTTVEQCPYEKVEAEGNRVLHHQVLYYFPGTANFKYGEQTVAGSWSDINYNASPHRVKGRNFNLWIDHGDRPQQEKYAYLLIPGIKAMADYDTTQVVIVRNDTLVQAVYQRSLDILQMVCYGAAVVCLEKMSIAVNQPCVMMLRGALSDRPCLYMADPEQNKKEMRYHFKNAVCDLEKTVVLPEKDKKGSNVKIEMLR